MSPYPFMNIDKAKFLEYHAQAVLMGIGYGFGSKDPVLGAFPIDYSAIDCSGYIRTLFYYASNDQNKLPDGSWMEGQFCKTQGYNRVPWESCGNHDNILRLCFHVPDGQDRIGHVWAVLNGHTYESYGHHGPGSRPWDFPLLKSLCNSVYEVADLRNQP